MEIGSILLAAGEGKRLVPLTNGIPKPALPVLDVPLGAWALSELVTTAAPVVVNASRHARELERRLRAACQEGWDLFEEGTEGYGTAGTVAALADRVGDELVVYNGDAVTDVDISSLRAEHRRSGAAITLAVTNVDSEADLVAAGDRIERFIDRRTTDESGARYVGVAVLTRAAVAGIPTERPLGLGESVFAPMAAAGDLGAYFHDGYALDVGTVDRYVRANVNCLHGFSPAPPVRSPGQVIEVPGGKAYVGPNARADDGTLGPGAVLLRGSVVAHGAYVERAVVFEEEVVTAGNEVRDAVWIDDRAVSS